MPPVLRGRRSTGTRRRLTRMPPARAAAATRATNVSRSSADGQRRFHWIRHGDAAEMDFSTNETSCPWERFAEEVVSGTGRHGYGDGGRRGGVRFPARHGHPHLASHEIISQYKSSAMSAPRFPTPHPACVPDLFIYGGRLHHSMLLVVAVFEWYRASTVYGCRPWKEESHSLYRWPPLQALQMILHNANIMIIRSRRRCRFPTPCPACIQYLLSMAPDSTTLCCWWSRCLNGNEHRRCTGVVHGRKNFTRFIGGRPYRPCSR
ncbi:hypothetical protein B0H16DRAFT_422568 [Mycena metata]|uniref:Uncharacterized protein n=1 Tax=Mycena metata TaxID=1033252 RepID=A0AAD7HE93_9AGAR|nr:hypothetical protein B0H16DRAFT_422568 [Mycena metata]